MPVSVLIVTRNRPEFLRFVLSQVAERVRPEDEIIVIDDGSEVSQEPAMEVLEDKCTVRFVRHWQSTGQVYRRNQGIESASHDCLLQLDDDAWPVELDALALSEKALKDHPDVGAFALPIHYHWSGAPDGCGSLSKRWRLPHLCRETGFMGCGVVLRRKAFLDAGGYPEYCRHGIEETALSLRLHRIGFKTRMNRSVRVIHGHDALSTSACYRSTRNTYMQAELMATELATVRDTLPRPWSVFAATLVRMKAARRRCGWNDVRRRIIRSTCDALNHHHLSHLQCATWAWITMCVRARLCFTSDSAVKAS